MTAVCVAQLVYSNVESEHSPTGRRGFQVWLCSPRLKEHSREIAKRIEDFDWPTPDADRNHLTERLVFFRTAGGDFVIARTVPIAERDALRRAGRFHAHAVVASPSEFARIGNDPFVLVDHFPFQDDPRRMIEDEVWRGGHLPDETPITVGVAKPPEIDFGESVRSLLPLLCRWLNADDPRPAAVAAPPDRVAAFLRSLFRVLPVSLRARASFDTLSTGQSLSTLHFRFAGGYDAPTVRDWPYRRGYRLDVDGGSFATPPDTPANPGLDHLAAAWLGDDSLTDADREDSFRLLTFLQDSTAGTLPRDVTGRAFELVRSAPGIEHGADRLFRDRLAADVPFASLHPLLEGKAKEWVGPFSVAAVDRLSSPIPLESLAAWLQQQAEQRELTGVQAADLEAWTSDLLKKPDDDAAKETLAKLFLIALRWRPDAGDRLAALRAKPGWDHFVDGWFRDWFYRLSQVTGWLATPATALQFAEALLASSSRLPPLALQEAEIHLSFPAAAEDGPGRKPLAFAVAFRRQDAKRMADLLSDREDQAFVGWAVAQARRLGLTIDFALHEVAGQQWPGVSLTMAGPTDPAATHALFEAFAAAIPARRELLFRGRDEAAKLAVRPIIRPDERLKPAEAAYTRENWDKVADRLDALDLGEVVQFLMERLFDKCHVTRTVAQRTGGSLWVGVVLEPFIYHDLFNALYGATIGAAKRHPDRSRDRVAAMLAAVEIK